MVFKTKEMVIDFRTKRHTPDSDVLKGSDVERVSLYKYLGIVINLLVKRLNIRMYCLRKIIILM